MESEQDHEIVITVTDETPERLRILSSPLPQYELAAARESVRGDVVRITGSAHSCNIHLTRVGAKQFAERLSAARERMGDWLELRARIVHRRKGGPRYLIEFIPDVDLQVQAEHRNLGATGAALAAEVWTADEFADWEPTDA